MRRLPLLLACLAAACGGRTTAPEPAAPAPAARPAATPAEPTTLRYAPGASRYRVETTFHSTTEIMGNSQVADGSILQIVSVTLASQGENLAAEFILDSVALTGQSPPNLGDPAALRGRVFRAVISPSGRTISMTLPDTTNPVFATAAEGLRDFLPALPPAPISAGQTWTDTLSNTIRQPGTNIRTQAIRQHLVAGWETRDGARALRISSTTATTMSGEGETQGQAIQLTGTGIGAADRWVSSAGAFVAQTASDSTNINVTVISMGLEVPVRQTRRAVITRLP